MIEVFQYIFLTHTTLCYGWSNMPCHVCTHLDFISGSVKVKLLIMGGVDGSSGLCRDCRVSRRWLFGDVSTPRGRLLDLAEEELSATSSEPVIGRLLVRVAAAGRVIARSVYLTQRIHFLIQRKILLSYFYNMMVALLQHAGHAITV